MIWRLIAEKIITYQDTLYMDLIDIYKLNAVIDCKNAIEKEAHDKQLENGTKS